MRSPDPYIFDLIKSLQPGEKDSFGYWVKSLPSFPAYAVLFEFINSQSAYDEDKAKSQFFKKYPNRNFKQVKNQLKEVLFRIMVRSYGAAQRSAPERVELVRELKNRGLYALCHREILFAKRKLWQEEQFSQLMELLKVQIDLFLEIYPEDKFREEGEALFSEQAKVKSLQENLYAFQKAKWDHYYLFKKKHYQSGEIDLSLIDSISSLSIFQDEGSALSLRARKEFLFQKARIARFKKRFAEAFEYLTQLYTLFESTSYLREEDPRQYYRVISQITAFHFMFSRIEEAKTWLKKLDLNLTENESLHRFVRERFFINAFNLAANENGIGKQLEQEILQFVYSHQENQLSRYMYRLLLVSAIHFFDQGATSQGQKLLRIIFQYKNDHASLDLQCLARLVEMLFYLKLEDTDAIEYRLRATRRFLKKHGFEGDFASTFFKFLHQYIKATERQRKNTLVQEFASYLRQKPDHNPFSLFFSFTDWFKNHHQ